MFHPGQWESWRGAGGARRAGKGLSVDLPCSPDGRVSFELLPRKQSVCQGIQGTRLPEGSVAGGWRFEQVGEQGKRGEVTGKDGSVLGGVERYRGRLGSHRDGGEGRGPRTSPDRPLPRPVVNCSITWAVYMEDHHRLLLLVEIEDPAAGKRFQVVSYDLGNWGTTRG